LPSLVTSSTSSRRQWTVSVPDLPDRRSKGVEVCVGGLPPPMPALRGTRETFGRLLGRYLLLLSTDNGEVSGRRPGNLVNVGKPNGAQFSNEVIWKNPVVGAVVAQTRRRGAATARREVNDGEPASGFQ